MTYGFQAMQLFNRYVSTRSLTVFAGELLLIFGSVALAASVQNTPNLPANLWKIALVTLICQLCLYYNDFYDLTLVHSNRELVVRLLQAAGAASIILAAMYFLRPGLMIGNGIFVSALFVFLVAILGWRLAFNRVTGSLKLQERVLFVGTGESARKVARQILDQHDFAYRIIGFIDDDASRIGERIVNPAIVGTPADIDRLVADHHIDRIVVGLSDRRGRLPIQELLRAKMAGVRVEDATTTYERVTGKILLDDLRPSWLIFSDGFRVSRVMRMMKRTIDLVLSIVMVVLGLPLMAMTALVIWIDDGSPVLYRQERVGENGRTFVLSKFRSMRTDAEKGGTPIWARDGDDRITRVGRVIRPTRLDELPQLWNVIRGDMSFVGPRPERPYFVAELSREIPFYQQRHAVKPGLTGWAQVKYRYGSSLEDAMEKLRYDLYYIKHLSVFFDLTIVFDTVKVVLFRKGAA
jgi:sugar transferase (PEP-CTERM system associated)